MVGGPEIAKALLQKTQKDTKAWAATMAGGPEIANAPATERHKRRKKTEKNTKRYKRHKKL